MIVTLDAFSGRQNPSWRLSDKDRSRLVERIAGKVLQAESESVSDGHLGPRGYVIDASSDDELPGGVPLTFRLGAPQGIAAEGQMRTTAFSVSESQEIS